MELLKKKEKIDEVAFQQWIARVKDCNPGHTKLTQNDLAFLKNRYLENKKPERIHLP